MKPTSRISPPGNLDLVPQLLQYRRHPLTVLPLNLDQSILDRPAASALLFESLCEGFQLILGKDEILND